MADEYEIRKGRMVKVRPALPAGPAEQKLQEEFIQIAGLPRPNPGGPFGPTEPVDYISLAGVVDTAPLDDALDKICRELGLKSRPGGASGYGWSTRSLLLACPYKYKRLYIEAPKHRDGPAALALETGGLVHQLLAFYYMEMLPDRGGLKAPVDYEWMKGRLLDEKVSAEVVMESYRLFDAYRMRYLDNDYLRPLDVEIAAEDADGNTCRYDAIVEVLPNETGVAPGTYLCEHKTCARFDFATLESWRNDGQIVGQLLIYKKARLKKKYGDLSGIIVNLISKTKVPDFRRIVVAPLSWQMKGHAKDMKVWDALAEIFRATGYYPRNRYSCRGPYGLCPLFETCAGG
jgi:hypothetical protein